MWQIRRVVLAFADGLELDTALFELRRDGQAVPLEPLAFDVLAYLVTHRERVVPKEELMDVVWGGRFVSEAAVGKHVGNILSKLGLQSRRQVANWIEARGLRSRSEAL